MINSSANAAAGKSQHRRPCGDHVSQAKKGHAVSPDFCVVVGIGRVINRFLGLLDRVSHLGLHSRFRYDCGASNAVWIASIPNG